MALVVFLHLFFIGADSRRTRASDGDALEGSVGDASGDASSDASGAALISSFYKLPGARCKTNDSWMSCASSKSDFSQHWNCMGCPSNLHTSLALEYEGRFWADNVEGCTYIKDGYTSTAFNTHCFSSGTRGTIAKKWFTFLEANRKRNPSGFSQVNGFCRTTMNRVPHQFQLDASSALDSAQYHPVVEDHCRKACELDFGSCLAFSVDYQESRYTQRGHRCSIVGMTRLDATINNVFYRNIVWDAPTKGDGYSGAKCFIRRANEAHSPPTWMVTSGFFDDVHAYLVLDYRAGKSGDCMTLLHRTPPAFETRTSVSSSYCKQKCDNEWDKCVAYATNGHECKLYEFMIVQDSSYGEVWNPITSSTPRSGFTCNIKNHPWSPPGMSFDWGLAAMLTW